MVYWEMCCRENETGFQCELPKGTYFIGDPNEMLFPGILATIDNLNTGTFQDAESDAIIVLHPFAEGEFLLVDADGSQAIVNNESGTIALMSADIVRPSPEFDEVKLIFDKRVVVVVNIVESTFTMTHDNNVTTLTPYQEPEESDEQMYTRLYAAQGIKY